MDSSRDTEIRAVVAQLDAVLGLLEDNMGVLADLLDGPARHGGEADGRLVGQ